MIFDSIAFHTEEDYPAGLPAANAANHIGFYWSWAVRRKLHNPEWEQAEPEALAQLTDGTLSGADFVLTHMGGSLEDTDFNREGRLFSLYYYEDEEEGYGQFMEDYVTAMNTPALESFYHTETGRAQQLLLDGVFDAALLKWRSSLREPVKE